MKMNSHCKYCATGILIDRRLTSAYFFPFCIATPLSLRAIIGCRRQAMGERQANNHDPVCLERTHVLLLCSKDRALECLNAEI